MSGSIATAANASQPGLPSANAVGEGAPAGAPKVRVAIVGATGYAGADLVRILERHPYATIAGLSARGRENEPVAKTWAHLSATGYTIDDKIPDADAIFFALPHGVVLGMIDELLERKVPLIDVGPDFRLKSPADYPRWYGFEHSRPDLLESAVYGLPELHRTAMAEMGRSTGPRIIGGAGCYPTATILALAPLARAGLIGDLVVDAKSGVSGAGREAKQDNLFSEVNESIKAYGLGGHRHVAEIEQQLTELGANGPLKSEDANPGTRAVDFLPHLIPMNRGILSAGHVRPTRPVTQQELDALYDEMYRDEPFVQVVKAPPATKHVMGSNLCRVHVRLDERTGRIIAIGVIDNLVKGAAGQSVQCMNVVLGLPETAGLEQMPLYP